MKKFHDCPICGEPASHMDRYPLEVCGECASRACDDAGRRVSFIVISLFGGLVATYNDTGERYHDRYCWIDGIRCEAEEHRFGGIVIQRMTDNDG